MDREDDDKADQTEVDYKEEQTEAGHKEEHREVDEKCEKDDEIGDLHKSQRFTMVRGKLGTEKQQDEQDKEMDDLWNEFAGRGTETSGGKNQNETKFLMIGDVLTVNIFPLLVMDVYYILTA